MNDEGFVEEVNEVGRDRGFGEAGEGCAAEGDLPRFCSASGGRGKGNGRMRPSEMLAMFVVWLELSRNAACILGLRST